MVKVYEYHDYKEFSGRTVKLDEVRDYIRQSFVVVDLEGEGGPIVDSWHAGERRIVDEASLVPREGGGERDAWLLAPVFDGATKRSSYVVLDCADLAAGPVCELPLPSHIPWGLHGAWLGEESGGAAVCTMRTKEERESKHGTTRLGRFLTLRR